MTERNELGTEVPLGTEGNVTEVARFELLEERAQVEKRREVASTVRVRREVERRTVTLTAELLTETVFVEVVRGSGVGSVVIDGVPLAEGETREIVTYREEAEVVKRPVIAEEVRLLKRAVTNRETLDVELGREVLRFVRAEPADLETPDVGVRNIGGES
ncbi:DUF2382 domain-containing protein [Deinococcus pimensis]|uniref:DUF2382 domain-containing protein n=1 Tax=Deinococcus pimensis TaxID=309888 RepID=UPI0004806E06|nr:DUF2382 domain-containing protein [Deinococcus pimensis]